MQKNEGERYEILWNYQEILLKLDHSVFLKLLKVNFLGKSRPSTSKNDLS
jgi:hypothetical protein